MKNYFDPDIFYTPRNKLCALDYIYTFLFVVKVQFLETGIIQ